MKRLGILVMVYGVALAFAGLLGWWMSERNSTSALLNGIVVGVAVVGIGFQMRLGRAWTVPASLMATAVFLVTFLWRTLHHVTLLDDPTQHHGRLAILMGALALVTAPVSLKLLKMLRYQEYRR